jgi:hypothetical protein
MAAPDGNRLAETIRQQLEEINQLGKGLDEATASQSPAGRWSPKEIISHLCGPEGMRYTKVIQTILEQDTPLVEVEAANTYFTGKRSQMSLAELLSLLKEQYGSMAEKTAGLSDENLARKLHVPLFKDSPLGEYPTLAMFISAMTRYHLGEHIQHLKEILQLLGLPLPPTK